jgi:hypothetical protein
MLRATGGQGERMGGRADSPPDSGGDGAFAPGGGYRIQEGDGAFAPGGGYRTLIPNP